MGQLLWTPFSKLIKLAKRNDSFPMSGWITQTKLIFPNCRRMKPFLVNLETRNPLDKDFIDYNKLIKSGLEEQQALKKLQVKTVPPFGLDNYIFLRETETWKKNGMTVFKDFLKWYNNKDVVPTLEAMQGMIQFYPNKGIDRLKLGCNF